MHGEHSIPDEYRQNLETILSQFLRNSMVHGVESPEERIRSKKPAQGSIRVYFGETSSGSYELRFHDDGSGLSPSKIKQSAVNKGLITQEAAEKLNDKQTIPFILKPGFSSVDEVDEDAGRGVGMDAVMATIKKLGGNLKIRSSESEYCEFTISLPSLT